MVKATKLKHAILSAAAALICLLLAFGLLNGTFAVRAADEEESFTDYPTTAVSVTNSQFTDEGSGSPASPSNWTATGQSGHFGQRHRRSRPRRLQKQLRGLQTRHLSRVFGR